MTINSEIPGQQSEFELRAIELVSSLVPENGTAVEIGSLFGRSSFSWAKSIPQSASLFCIDPWEPGPGSQPLEQRYGVSYSIETFKRHLTDCPNVTPIQGYSPNDVQDWEKPIDLFFEDAVHRNPIFKQNIEFWSSFLKPTGIACGDDYRPRYPDIVNGVNTLAKKLGRSIITVDFFWCLLPSEELVPGTREVEDKLRALSKEAYDYSKDQIPVIFAEPISVFKTIKIGTERKVRVRVCSFYVDDWEQGNSSKNIEYGVRLYKEKDISSPVIHESRFELDTPTLYPDTPLEEEIELPTEGFEEGQYYAVYGVYDETGQEFMSERRGVPQFIPYTYLR